MGEYGDSTWQLVFKILTGIFILIGIWTSIVVMWRVI